MLQIKLLLEFRKMRGTVPLRRAESASLISHSTCVTTQKPKAGLPLHYPSICTVLWTWVGSS